MVMIIGGETTILKIKEGARVGRDLGTEVPVGSRGNALISDILGRRVTIMWSPKSDAILSVIVVFT